jgi:hypothetical protein
MTRKGLLLAGLSGALLLGADQSSAVTTVTYSFDGGSAVPSVAGGIVTAGNATTGGDVDLSTIDNAARVRSDATSEGLSAAVTAMDFVSVTVTGADYGISNISYVHSVSDTFNLGNYTTHLLASPIGFTDTGSVLNVTRTGDEDPLPPELISVDTSVEPIFQNLSGTTEIRVYFSDTVTNNGHVHLVDNLIVTVTPEPGSLALLGMGGACLLWRRRRA